MSDYISIKHWHEDDQPREKLERKGSNALTDAELLAILILTGTKERSAVDIAKDVLALGQNNLGELGRLSIQELKQIRGIGPAKAITLAAALALGRRRQQADGIDRTLIRDTNDAVEVFMPLLQDLNHECFYVMYLTKATKVIKTELLSSGGLSSTVADIRMILKNALLCNSTQLIIAHNHPSGTMKPSEQDLRLTKKLKDAAELMDIKLLDHIIIAGTKSLSLANEGYF